MAHPIYPVPSNCRTDRPQATALSALPGEGAAWGLVESRLRAATRDIPGACVRAETIDDSGFSMSGFG